MVDGWEGVIKGRPNVGDAAERSRRMRHRRFHRDDWGPQSAPLRQGYRPTSVPVIAVAVLTILVIALVPQVVAMMGGRQWVFLFLIPSPLIGAAAMLRYGAGRSRRADHSYLLQRFDRFSPGHTRSPC
jgi:hypothetical protein